MRLSRFVDKDDGVTNDSAIRGVTNDSEIHGVTSMLLDAVVKTRDALFYTPAFSVA